MLVFIDLYNILESPLKNLCITLLSSALYFPPSMLCIEITIIQAKQA